MPSTVSIGKLVATFGLKGELVMQHALGGKSDFDGLKAVFIELQRGSQIPYFLDHAQGKASNETLVKFDGINSKEEAKALLQKHVWVPEDDFLRLVKPSATIALLGYIIVEGKRTIGTISEVIEQPHQVLCSVVVDGKEALIPLNESTLVKIDRKAKQVIVELPDGLLDIYLGN